MITTRTASRTRAIIVGAILPLALASTAADPGVPSVVTTFDERLDLVAAEVPAFAGLRYDGAVLVISVVDGSPASAAAAQSVAAEILGDADLAAAELSAEEVTFSWQELRGWYHDVWDEVWRAADVTMMDLDEARNVIRIGVADLREHGPTVLGIAAARGVPEEALDVVGAPAVVPDGSSADGPRGSRSQSWLWLAVVAAVVGSGWTIAVKARKRRSSAPQNSTGWWE